MQNLQADPKKLNQSGIAHVAAIVILILVAGLGFAGWRVYSTQKENDKLKSQNTSTPTKTEDKQETAKSDIPEGFVEYKNEEFAISLYHPADWKVGKDGKLPHPTIRGIEIPITSADYASEEEAIGGTTTAKGGIVKVSVYTTEHKSLEDYHPIESNNPYTNFFRDKKYTVATVDGITAWQYDYDYEGDSSFVTAFIKNGKYYNIAFNGESRDEKTSVLFPIYQQIIKTIKIK